MESNNPQANSINTNSKNLSNTSNTTSNLNNNNNSKKSKKLKKKGILTRSKLFTNKAVSRNAGRLWRCRHRHRQTDSRPRRGHRHRRQSGGGADSLPPGDPAERPYRRLCLGQGAQTGADRARGGGA